MSLKKLDEKFNKLLKNTEKIKASIEALHQRKANDVSIALDSDNPKIRLAAVTSPYFGPEHIDKALNDQDSQVRYAAALSSHFGEQHFDKAFNHEDGMVREAATRSPYFNKQHVDKALSDKDVFVRKNAILSPHFGPEHIDKALNDKNVGNRTQAILSPHFGPEHFDKTLNDLDPYVRLATVHSPTFGPEHMDKYIDHLHSKYLEDEKSLTSRPSNPNYKPRRTLTKEEYGNYLKLLPNIHQKNTIKDTSNFKYKGPDALWVSMQKDADKGEDTNLTGEMCVTPFGEKEDLFRERPNKIGYVFRGKPSHFFPFDAYSSVDRKTGKRHMELENLHPNTNQKEAWLEPHKSEHVGTIHVSESPNLDHFLQNDQQGLSLARDTHTQGLRHWTRFSSGKQIEIKPEHLETDGEIKIKKSLDQQFKELLEKLSNNYLSKGNPDK